MAERETVKPEQDGTDGNSQRRIYRGNVFDISALVALATGLLTLFICGSMGYALYCLPLFPLILGIVGLATARKSVDPERTRLLSWVSVGAGGVILLIALAFIALWFVAVLAWIVVFPFMLQSGG
jgi:hypothetical protein